MHDIGKNRMRATPSFKMNQNIDPVPFTPVHERKKTGRPFISKPYL